MGFKKRKLLLLQKLEKDDDEDYGKDLSPCPEICYSPCTGCKIENEKDTLIYTAPSTPPPPPSSTNHASSILVVVACLLGFAFVVVSYLLIIRYRMSVRNSRRRGAVSVNGDSTREEFFDENHGPVVDHPIWFIRTVGLNHSVIDSISVIKYKSGGEGLVEGTDCSVCLSEFEEDESLRLLPKCSHAFHIHCIDTWLRAHKNCPLCRAPIVVGDGNALEVNPEESNSGGSRYGENFEVGRMNDHEEDRGGVGGMLVENESSISLPIEGENSGNEIRGKNSGYRHEREKRVRVKSDLVEHRVMMVVDEENQEREPVRRSISMDSLSASLIHHKVTNMFQAKREGSSSKKDEGPSDLHMAIEAKQISRSRNPSIYSRVMKSSSFGRSLQKVPSSMKRSFSCGGGALY